MRDITRRRPLKAVQILLPAWGGSHIQTLLDFGIPTLLAAGNVPALASILPTKFIVMTRSDDVPLIELHSAWLKLKSICEAEIRIIDELITRDNHSACLTLAFEQAIRSAGEAMVDTCFFLMNSDFLVADGSLERAFDRINQGASAVLAGNFQIIAEDASSILLTKADSSSRAIALSPRELLDFSFNHLHPATAANVVNFGLAHNSHINRLFWRVDAATLIGRFYLLHVVAIRPEIDSFSINSSYDYSFIPELCPSNSIAQITDSDEYLVVELQPRSHEIANLRICPIAPTLLAASLSEWTTAQHRANVEKTMVFHSRDIPACTERVIAEADTFMEIVTEHLSKVPQPYRDHPYWIGSRAVHQERTGHPFGMADWQHFRSWQRSKGGFAGAASKARYMIFGAPPAATMFHPKWADYALVLEYLKDGAQILLVAENLNQYAAWLAMQPHISSVEAETLLDLDRSGFLFMAGRYDRCVLVLSETLFSRASELLNRTGPLVRPGGTIIVSVQNLSPEWNHQTASRYAGVLSALLKPHLDLKSARYVPASNLRQALYGKLSYYQRKLGAGSALTALFAAAASGLLGIVSLLCNCLLLRRRSVTGVTGHFSTMIVELSSQTHPVPMPLPDKLDVRGRRSGLATKEARTETAALMLMTSNFIRALAERKIIDADSADRLAKVEGSLLEAWEMLNQVIRKNLDT